MHECGLLLEALAGEINELRQGKDGIEAEILAPEERKRHVQLGERMKRPRRPDTLPAWHAGGYGGWSRGGG